MAAENTYAKEAASGGLPQFDFSTWGSQIFWLILTFGILYFVLANFILPRIGKGISERSDRIADDLDTASRMQKDAEQALLEYERVTAAAKAKAHNIAETTRKSVDAEVEREIEAAEAEFANKQAIADERISKIRASALSKIDTVAEDTVSAIVEKLGSLKASTSQIKSAISSLKG